MYLKIHNIPGQGEILAVYITIDPSFYGDILATEAEVLAALTASANANLIGKRVCDLAIAAGLLDKKSCIMIGDIPHAQIYGL